MVRMAEERRTPPPVELPTPHAKMAAFLSPLSAGLAFLVDAVAFELPMLL